ncbi:MAG TPA: outer membrane beta-barrel protein [Gammaproteobacteria bacterium]|nr:outer membrane beta-barrel protein [Gammaproteobacteria bacterium]
MITNPRLGLLKMLFAVFLFSTLTTLAFAAFPPPAGWYIEGNGGYSTVSSKSYGAPNVRRSGMGWNLNLGYKLTNFFAAEAGYTHYFPTRVYNGPKIGQDNHYSYDLAAKAMLPISDSSVNIFGKLGLARVHSDLNITNNSLASGLNLTTGARNVTGLYMALGMEYYFAPSIAANIQWARAHGDSQTGDLNLYAAGLSYNFG